MSIAEKESCPHLPRPELQMSHRCLTKLETNTSDFYFKALQYGNYLWQTGHAGRAILAITRALYADIDENDPVLEEWPLPYAALEWILANQGSDDFPGNPRISFQHQATRLRGEREALRRARAWAVWALVRKARPSLPGDLDDPVQEPDQHQIHALLIQHGHKTEADLWSKSIRDC
ncbi:MAG: hypothetical protein AAF065_05420 [Verrucomicrobiota bacterium]